MADRQQVVATLTDLFVKYGYSGTSLNRICQATGLGRGSIYYLFPQGKSQMLRSVLDAIAQDFAKQVLAPLENDDIEAMFIGLKDFYRDGKRGSLTGMTALDVQGINFVNEIRAHYDIWRGALTKTLIQNGVGRGEAASISERTIAGIEGALVLTSAFDDAGALGRTTRTLLKEINDAIESQKALQSQESKSAKSKKRA